MVADEGFSHSVALRTFDGRRSPFKTDVASEAACIIGNVAAAVVRQSFFADRQTIDGRPRTISSGAISLAKILRCELWSVDDQMDVDFREV